MNKSQYMSVIDIEKGGATARSVVLSIGITTLDATTLEQVSQFYVSVNPYCDENAAREWCNGARSFWISQSDDVRDEAMRVMGSATLTQALTKLSEYIALLKSTGNVHVIGDCNNLDIEVLNNAFIQTQIKTPWERANEQSISAITWFGRTFFGIDYTKATDFDGTKNHALYDSGHNAAIAAKTINYIKHQGLTNVTSDGIHTPQV